MLRLQKVGDEHAGLPASPSVRRSWCRSIRPASKQPKPRAAPGPPTETGADEINAPTDIDEDVVFRRGPSAVANRKLFSLHDFKPVSVILTTSVTHDSNFVF
jgi:hypothetical protein